VGGGGGCGVGGCFWLLLGRIGKIHQVLAKLRATILETKNSRGRKTGEVCRKCCGPLSAVAAEERVSTERNAVFYCDERKKFNRPSSSNREGVHVTLKAWGPSRFKEGKQSFEKSLVVRRIHGGSY